MKTDNELIALFMGAKEVDPPIPGKTVYEFKFGNIGLRHANPENMSFGESWDWLMPVVEKIWSLGYSFILHFPSGEYFFTGIVSYNNNYHKRQETDINNTSPVNCTYLAVVEFIKWYNQQKP